SSNITLKVVATNITTPTCQTTLTDQVSATVNNPPSPAVSFFPSSYCQGDTPDDPQVTPDGAATAVNWYSDISLATPIVVGDPENPTAAELGFSTASARSKTVYVTQTVGGCKSLPTPVTIVVYSLP